MATVKMTVDIPEELFNNFWDAFVKKGAIMSERGKFRARHGTAKEALDMAVEAALTEYLQK
jgi:hypothetical protein